MTSEVWKQAHIIKSTNITLSIQNRERWTCNCDLAERGRLLSKKQESPMPKSSRPFLRLQKKAKDYFTNPSLSNLGINSLKYQREA